MPASAPRDAIPLKELQTRRKKIVAEMDVKQQELQDAQKTVNGLGRSLKGIDKQIAEATLKDPVVSEHAILRFLERKYGIDIEDLKREILEMSGLGSITKRMINGKLPMGEKLKAVVKNNVVVSVTGGKKT